MAESLKERIRADLNAARRSKDRLRTTVLTTVLSEVRNKEIEQGRDATDEDVIGVVMKGIKQRKEAADQMRDAGREELAEKEEREAEILDAYTPESMSESEVRGLVQEIVASGADNMGAVMGALMPKIRGRFEGKEANRIVREELT
ncbi:MAG: GatB/YqeY domain-containing protein [Longimicrobiales bacterium]|nr:GatB/YqeY domain-containing protein [Longimicrobiales bacterium]